MSANCYTNTAIRKESESEANRPGLTTNKETKGAFLWENPKTDL